MLKVKSCRRVEDWVQMSLFPNAEMQHQRSNATGSSPNLPGWIGFPIRFGSDTHSAGRER